MRLLHLFGEAPGNFVRTCYTFSNTLEKDSPANANHTLTSRPLFKAIVRDPQLLLAETFRTAWCGTGDTMLATWDIRSENRFLMNNHSSRFVRAITADSRNKHDLGNDFILPVIPVQGSQQPFWEQLKFTLNSCIRA
jgi:hypothetical protein